MICHEHEVDRVDVEGDVVDVVVDGDDDVKKKKLLRMTNGDDDDEDDADHGYSVPPWCLPQCFHNDGKLEIHYAVTPAWYGPCSFHAPC